MAVSRDLLRAVLEVRDRRHVETHAALVALYQALVVELIDSGALQPGNLADRVRHAADLIPAEVHGDAARHLVSHVLSWLSSIDPSLPVAIPDRWKPPRFHEVVADPDDPTRSAEGDEPDQA